MITRHHISLACGGTFILYLPLVSGNLIMLPVILAGVCIGAVLPDIQMKRPRGFNVLSLVWLMIQVFRKTVLRIYIMFCTRILGIHQAAEDKRLTHSLPGLYFLTLLIASGLILIMGLLPAGPEQYYARIFAAGIIIGLIFHFLEDICTKKGVCILYPFDEKCKISGSIRPCNSEDTRIREFHIMTGTAIAAIILLYCTGLCPDDLKWPVSIVTLAVCTIMMLRHSDVKLTPSA